ncbi:MAG: PAS domain S-box protein, partial [Arenimonas sp.]
MASKRPTRSPSQLSEPQYRLLWETTTDAVIIIDEKSTIRYANPALKAAFGYSPEEAVGQPLRLLQPERMRGRHAAALDRYLRTGEKRLDWRAMESVGLHRDGHEFPLEISFSDLEIDGRRMFAAFLRDITDRARSERMQAALHKISEAAHSAPDLQHLFQAIHEIISELLPAKNFYVALYDEATDLLSFPYWVDELDPRPEPRKLKERRGLTGLVLETGEPLLLSPDTIGAVVTRPDVTIIGTDGVDWLGIPLKTSRGTIGVLTVQNYTGLARYTEKDKELLQFVSDQVAAAVERKQAQQAVLESEQRFRSVFDQSPIIIALLSYPEGRFQEINAAGLEAFGYAKDEVLGRTTGELNVWVDPGERKRFADLLQARGAARNFETLLRRRDGSTFTVL